MGSALWVSLKNSVLNTRLRCRLRKIHASSGYLVDAVVAMPMIVSYLWQKNGGVSWLLPAIENYAQGYERFQAYRACILATTGILWKECQKLLVRLGMDDS